MRTDVVGRRRLLRRGGAYGAAAMLGRAVPGAGATIRVGMMAPTGAIDPVTVGDTGGLVLLQQAGEFLVLNDPDLRLRPQLATSWSADATGSVWTFTLRRGVTFHSGKPMTADDVVYSLARLADPKRGSNALSTFKGVLTPDGVVKRDDHTVAFHLAAPNGNFPYLVSSDNYNAIICPKGSDATRYEADFDGTGPFRLERYRQGQAASFVRNPHYWGGAVLPARTLFEFFGDQPSQIFALQDHQLDVLQQIALQGAQGLLRDRRVRIIRLRSSAHREVHMRNDVAPFNDKRVRQAVALTLNRPAIVHGLFRGLSDLGNDSPFAPVFPSTDPDIPQRTKNIARARKLMAEAGYANGAHATLTALSVQEIPDYAVLIQNAAAEIGLRIDLKIETSAAYYGTATFGSSDWLDSTMGITDYGHRGVPNVFLSATLASDGPWNAAHFKNPAYDQLVATYAAALDLPAQRTAAGAIQTLLLDQTPIIYAYFFDYLAATGSKVRGVAVNGIGQVFLRHATIAATA